MKKLICVLLSVVLLFSLSACKGEKKDKDGDTAPASYTLRYPIDAAYAERDTSIKDAYVSLCEAVVNYAPELRMNESFVGDACDIMNTSFPLSVLVKSITVKEDGSGVMITYKMTQAEHNKAVNDFNEKVNGYIAQCSENGAGAGAYLLNAYHFVASSLTYENNNELTCYDAIVNGKANENTYAKMFEFLLAQKDISVYHINAHDNADNLSYLSLAQLGGEYYYFDPFGESSQEQGKGIGHFGLNSTELKSIGIQSTETYTMQTPPVSLDMKFEVCRKAVSWSVEGNALLITTKNNDLVKLDL